MKLKNTKKRSNTLLKLKIIKTKALKKKQNFNHLKIEDIEYRLKKILYIIYRFHICNKKILFVGTPLKLYKNIQKIFRNTQHIILPQKFIIKGFLSNKQYRLKQAVNKKKLITKNLLKLLFQLNSNINLIVLLDETKSKHILYESFKTKIPVLSLNSDLHLNNYSYQVPGFFTSNYNKLRHNLFYNLLFSIFKKGNIERKNYIKELKEKLQREKILKELKEKLRKEKIEKLRRKKKYQKFKKFKKKNNAFYKKK